MSNCDIHDCGRQGISLVGTKGVIIENCDIYNIGGTSPQSAIDIEPNDNTQISYNTIIRNNNIKNCYEGIFIVGYNAKVSNIEITSNAIESDNNGIYVSSYSDDPVTKGVSNINIRNNTISGGKFGINIPKSRNVEITNNYVYSESGYAMYFNPKNRAINVANNVTLSKIGILSGGSICLIGNIIDIISDEENVYALNIDNTSEYGSLVKSNKINGKVKLYSSSLDFSDNHVKHKLYSSNDVVSGNLINISDNKFEILDNENISVAGTDTCLNFYGLNSRIKNNIFCFPDNKTSYVIKVNASANKNEIRYNEFSNLPANKTIYVNSKENIIEGLFSNLRKSDIVPEYINTKRDYQAENVLFVNSETRRILSSDGNAVYDALGFPVAQPYKEGQTMYDSTLKKMKLWNGVDWTNLDGTPL